MAVIAPNSEIYLIKCPIELDNLNQLSFANATAQHNYFNGLPKLSLTKATFQRKDGTIRWPGSMEDIIEYNYCMYRNKNHGNKWFYAFIDNMEYVSDTMTSIKISTDVWQTWQFDITFKASYVEREHTNDDSFGSNTIPEGLDTGEFICNEAVSKPYIEKYFSTQSSQIDVVICVQLTTTTFTVGGTTSQITNLPAYSVFNGVAQGTYIVGIPYCTDYAGLLQTLVGAYDSAGKKDAILSMFLAPSTIATWRPVTGTGLWGGYSGFFVPQATAEAKDMGSYTLTRNTTIDGYTPKNNKLFVAPFNYIHASNNAGQDVEYYWENFIGNPLFYVYGCLDQGGNVKLIPANSKKSTETSWFDSGWNESLTAAKLPMLSWTSDYYLNWQAQNGKNIAIQTGLSALGFAVGAGQGIDAAKHAHGVETAVERGYFPWEERMQVNPGGLLANVINFASSVANTQNAIRNAKMVPPQAMGNTQLGNLQFSMRKCAFNFYKMSVRAEYARQIDNYFSMFGYKTNLMKVPNITGRTNWNYVKTLGCNILGDIPQGDLQALKAMFNNGITIWHNASTYLDYSQNNAIV